MKLGLVILVICLVPVILMAYDLNEVAKRERERRLGLAALRQGKPVRSFHDADLEVYRPGISTRNGSTGRRRRPNMGAS
jgi:hypothetical protein